MFSRFQRVVFFCGCCFLLLTAGRLEADGTLRPDVVEVSSAFVQTIFQDILAVQARFSELRDFGEESLSLNADGIPLIRYDFTDKRTGEVYSFGLTVSHLDRTEFHGEPGGFHYGFPALNVKISGFQESRPLRTQFHLRPLVSEHGMRLVEYQQNGLPLRIVIRPLKDAFTVGEPVEFDVILENVSKGHMEIQGLGNDTLYFLIGNQAWGTHPLGGRKGGETEILRAGEKRTLRFRGEGFDHPREIEMVCFYRMSVGGVNPAGKARIRIRKE